MLEPLLDAINPVRLPYGRPRQHPGKVHADKGYDYAAAASAPAPGHLGARRRRGVDSCRSWAGIAGWSSDAGLAIEIPGA